MKALPTTPDAAAAATMQGVSFTDAYRVVVLAPGLTARQAAKAIFTSAPRWTDALMAIRNAVMGLFGVKTSATEFAPPGQQFIGMFPLISESPQQVLLGFDDSHLDFRILVALHDDTAGATAITCTTAVLTHNWLGRSYLATILPFHRLIVRALLSRARFAR